MKTCAHCGVMLVQKENEFPYKFERRQTCNDPICVKEMKLKNLSQYQRPNICNYHGKYFDKRYRSCMTEGEWAIQQWLKGAN